MPQEPLYQANHSLLRLRKGRLLTAERLRIKALLRRRRRQRRRRMAPAATEVPRHRALGVHVVRTPPHHLHIISMLRSQVIVVQCKHLSVLADHSHHQSPAQLSGGPQRFCAVLSCRFGRSLMLHGMAPFTEADEMGMGPKHR